MSRKAAARDAAYYIEKHLGALPAAQRGTLAELAALHERYRRRARLSAAMTAEAYVVQMVVDSLKLNELLPPAQGERLADVGAGGGYPGLPLAIARPDLRVTLVEPAPRKAEYLRLAAAELGLANVAVEQEAAAALPSGAFGVACAKALAKPAVALTILLRLVRTGGRVVLFAGEVDADELGAAAATAGARLEAPVEYRLPGLARPRYLIAITREVSRET